MRHKVPARDLSRWVPFVKVQIKKNRTRKAKVTSIATKAPSKDVTDLFDRVISAKSVETTQTGAVIINKTGEEVVIDFEQKEETTTEIVEEHASAEE